jgi:hypothetical protein
MDRRDFADYKEKDWDEKFEEWKKKKEARAQKIEKTIEKKVEGLGKGVERSVDEVEREIEEVERRIKEYSKKTPRYIKVLKVLAVLIPVIIILYIIAANFLVNQGFEYSYDIGGTEDSAKSYLTPAERVSLVADDGVTYRNLTGGLVYFEIPVARGVETVDVEVKFKDNFPKKDGRFELGAKDQEDWHYLYKKLYNPAIDLTNYSYKGKVYRLNTNLPLVDETGLRNLNDITIASDEFTPVPNEVDDYSKTETVIGETLRGKHVFYVYASQDLKIEVEKQDINWYEGSDELFITLWDSDGVLVDMTQIGDDGITDANKTLGQKQSATLQVTGLNEGAYRLELSDFDGLITQIKINSNKIVTDKVFLAGNAIYGVETKESKLFFDYNKNVNFKLMTAHAAGFQKILINKDGNVEPYNYDVEDVPVYKEFEAGDYEVTFPKNDITVESPEYFAFTRDGYFRPWKQKVIPTNSLRWLMESADYLISDYTPPMKDGDWLIASASFDIEKDKLFITEDGKLSMVFNVPHLAKNETKDYVISIDWIKIKVTKPGVFR